MPELPEVETVARRLRVPLVGRTFAHVWVEWERMVQMPVQEFGERLVGQRVEGVGRRGKYLVLPLSSGDSLIIHLKMTGDLRVLLAADPFHQHDRIIFTLENGYQLRFRDQRKFGRVYLTEAPERVLGRIGPEPLDDGLSEDDFVALFKRRSARIKSLLLDQGFIAGLGNIYADEALFLASIQPQRRADTLTEEDRRRLYQAIRRVLGVAIERKGTSLPDETYQGGQYQQQFLVYGRWEEPCSRCGNPICRVRLGQRSAHFCSECQH